MRLDAWQQARQPSPMREVCGAMSANSNVTSRGMAKSMRISRFVSCPKSFFCNLHLYVHKTSRHAYPRARLPQSLQKGPSLLPMGEAAVLLLATLLHKELAEQGLLGPRPGRVDHFMSEGAVLKATAAEAFRQATASPQVPFSQCLHGIVPPHLKSLKSLRPGALERERPRMTCI